METRYLKIQQNLATEEMGRFIPYIGGQYDKGINNYRIVIIGPRHYCDGIYNSRNVLLGIGSESKLKLKTGSCFPPEFKVGCVKEKASSCLKEKKGRACPVYKNKICPLKDHCGIKQSLLCGGERNLRCETLYAIREFLKKPEIESARLGISYFGQITKFLLSQFKPNVLDISKIWDRVVFFNLIQRYIPLIDVYFDSNKIGSFINSEDVGVGKRLIQELEPDIIIMTMPCLSKKLKSHLYNEGYKIVSENVSYGYVVYSNKLSNIKLSKPEWQKKIDEMTDGYLLPEFSYQLRAFTQDILKEILRQFRSEIDGKSAENEVRKYLRSVFTEMIKRSEHVPSSISKISCFMETCKNPTEAIRQWMRYKNDD